MSGALPRGACDCHCHVFGSTSGSLGNSNNTPPSAVSLKTGDTVSFTKNEIVDCMYMDAGKLKGNYSARAILKSVPPKDRKVLLLRFGLDFDF